MFFSRNPSISAEEAAARLATHELVLVDVRQAVEVKGGRVPGSVNIPLTQLSDRLGELDRAAQIAFLCHSGARSARATAIARKAGYDALNVRGGTIAWKRAGLALRR